MDSYGMMNLQTKRENNRRLIYEIGLLYINDLSTRSKFMSAEFTLDSEYIEEYQRRRVTFGQAMKNLHEHYLTLHQNFTSLRMGRIKLFVIAEKQQERYSMKTLVLKNVGFIGGGLQFIGGVGTCFSGLRAACAKYGVPLMVNGGEILHIIQSGRTPDTRS